MDNLIPGAATPAATLEQRIMDPNIAKGEAEWWAHRRIAALEAENARLMGLVKEAGEALLKAMGKQKA